MYSPDEQGEYMPLDGALRFSMQGHGRCWGRDQQAPSRGIHILPHSPGMVMHVLKGDPVLRQLEHVQVDGPGTAYLFFYDKQGCPGLGQDTVYVIQAYAEEAFSEWILHSSHFAFSLLPLVEAWQQAVAASDH